MRNNDEIVAYVDNLRKSQNMSLNELARATGLAKSSLSRYFNKSRDFPVNKVHLFAKALHTSSEDILGFKPVHYPTSSTDYQSVQADKSTYVVKHDYPSNSIDTSGMHYVRVPIVGTIACGTSITANRILKVILMNSLSRNLQKVNSLHSDAKVIQWNHLFPLFLSISNLLLKMMKLLLCKLTMIPELR